MLHPTRTTPPPVAIDLERVVLVGTGIWGLALLVTGVLVATGELEWDIVWVCATGVVLGLLGAAWARRNRPAPPVVPTDAPPAQP
ncbi:DUF2530 domain-containing protein [Cellulomonas humilata]|uniref:DUF2530 domain-containing protein n=1 Tax=Cellulomonas humilata TaxID=144055 RepID=A0A7Y6A4L6_9CELL|nr:DUF2530 domain-containing protein [Cellulomonas humilata]NUU18948.1 DUF2530 domain-containing protein [Cellulomonas humilata]